MEGLPKAVELHGRHDRDVFRAPTMDDDWFKGGGRVIAKRREVSARVGIGRLHLDSPYSKTVPVREHDVKQLAPKRRVRPGPRVVVFDAVLPSGRPPDASTARRPHLHTP